MGFRGSYAIGRGVYGDGREERFVCCPDKSDWQWQFVYQRHKVHDFQHAILWPNNEIYFARNIEKKANTVKVTYEDGDRVDHACKNGNVWYDNVEVRRPKSMTARLLEHKE